MFTSNYHSLYFSTIGIPNVIRCNEYCVASSNARCAKPTALHATGGLVKSNAPIATINPLPSPPTTFFLGTTTFSNVIPPTSEPAPGSVTAYEQTIGSAIQRPRYSFFCSSLPNIMSGACGRALFPIALAIPVHPYANFSPTIQ
ncbi:hypothetical protein DERF_014975 [Dermatophagoides farinae]|uniref:Uncharacterized protein n=1 Tax=Dermatophagoides farinae TaxID=6954 RepID=A0A922HQ37_DERFA|nr:hypothetical protein DERF_014975 [Dermatophagoides farinae]